MENIGGYNFAQTMCLSHSVTLMLCLMLKSQLGLFGGCLDFERRVAHENESELAVEGQGLSPAYVSKEGYYIFIKYFEVKKRCTYTKIYTWSFVCQMIYNMRLEKKKKVNSVNVKIWWNFDTQNL